MVSFICSDFAELLLYVSKQIYNEYLSPPSYSEHVYSEMMIYYSSQKASESVSLLLY